MTLRPCALLGIVLSIFLGVTLGVLGHRFWPGLVGSAPPNRLVREAVQQVQANYVTAVDVEQLVDDALRGMANGLDRHSRYLDQAGLRSLQAEVADGMGGLIARWLVPGYAYVRIESFGRKTGDGFRTALGALAREQPIEGLALDLRSNSGGTPSAAVAVASALLDGGLVAYVEGRPPARREEHLAAGGDLLNGAPVVVMMDGRSASGAEVVAAALQDRVRALILGERSYGKGSMQSVLRLPNARALKLTTAHYHRPSGAPLDGQGVLPDLSANPKDSESLLVQALAVLKAPP